eukprot:6536978-Lingulodinium_polyedra.AAC.1
MVARITAWSPRCRCNTNTFQVFCDRATLPAIALPGASSWGEDSANQPLRRGMTMQTPPTR